MTTTADKSVEVAPLGRLASAMAEAVRESLHSLLGCELKVTARSVSPSSSDALLAGSGQRVVVRANLETGSASRTLRILLTSSEATTLVGVLTKSSEDTVSKRREHGVLDGEEVEAFGDVANALCTAVDGVLQQSVSGTRVQMQDHCTIDADELDSDEPLGRDPLVALRYGLEVAAYDATEMAILVDVPTAEEWNGGSIGEGDDEVPQTPVRGRMAAYTVGQETLATLRNTCRRAGLELDRHGQNEIPNPAAHRGEVLLIDVPVGETRRFEWCKRIKGFGADIRVVLLLHEPSRSRVYQGFRAGADVIVGWPIDDRELAEKLEALFPETADGTEPDKDDQG